MKIKATLKKLLSVITDLRQTAKYHYDDDRISIVRYLYYALFRINRFTIVLNDLKSNPARFDFQPPYHVEIPDPHEIRKIYIKNDLPREFNYGEILGLRLCFLLYCNEEIALITWISLSGEYSRFFNLGKDTAEIYYVTTLPRFRGQSLSGKMALYVSNYMREMGYKKIVVCMNEENVAAIKPLTRRGFQVIKTVRSIGPFNRKLVL